MYLIQVNQHFILFHTKKRFYLLSGRKYVQTDLNAESLFKVRMCGVPL